MAKTTKRKGGANASKRKPARGRSPKASAGKRHPPPGSRGRKRSAVWFPSINAICKSFKVAKRSYVRLHESDDYPLKGKQGYYGPDVKRFLDRTGLTKKDKPGYDKRTEETRKLQVQTELLELQMAKQRGLVVPIEQYQDDMRHLADIFLRALLNLKDQVSIRIRNAKTIEILDSIIRDCRSSTAEKLEKGK